LEKVRQNKTLWQHAVPPEAWIDEFTASADRNLDMALAPYDILGSLAHCRMLEKTGLLKTDECKKISTLLTETYRNVCSGNFVIEEGVEDIHSQIELILSRKLGEAGRKIHTGRSRNDQVLLDLRLFLRDYIRKTVKETDLLFSLLMDLSERHKDIFMPGYTHMQAAMPSSFGLWFAAYAESLVDDLIQMQSAYRLINKNPLGSAAGYGTSLPIDREMTTDLLGFEDLNYNAVYAQMGRGRTERTLAQAMCSVAETLGRLATDCVLFMSENFAFISFPEELTTGSSIMPHKRNPDVFEIIRARCNRIKSLPNEIMLISTNLPHGYHRDFQVIKESLIPKLSDLQNCIRRMHSMLSRVQVNRKLREDPKYQILGSVEAVNDLVLEGMPFRDAYLLVAEQIREGKFRPPRGVRYTHTGSIGNPGNKHLIGMKDSVLKKFGFERIDKMLDLLT
jgi:argininosuccinate lyase